MFLPVTTYPGMLHTASKLATARAWEVIGARTQPSLLQLEGGLAEGHTTYGVYMLRKLLFACGKENGANDCLEKPPLL